jgi:hypothetical protein
MQHSKNFLRVQKWYTNHNWPLFAVKNAVVQKWITAEEYKEITGEDYEESAEE